MTLPVKMDMDRIIEDIAVASKEPFRYQLAKMLECAPDAKSLKLFAKKSPEKWVQAVNNLAKLSGYNEAERGGDTNIYMQINNLPDSDLLAQLHTTLSAIKVIEEDKKEPAIIAGQVEEDI